MTPRPMALANRRRKVGGARRMMRHTRMLTCSLAALVTLIVGVTSPEAWAAKRKLAIYWEYNSSVNDLGVHVFLDGEDWRELKIINPAAGRTGCSA
jgi:hypothetical protein